MVSLLAPAVDLPARPRLPLPPTSRAITPSLSDRTLLIRPLQKACIYCVAPKKEKKKGKGREEEGGMLSALPADGPGSFPQPSCAPRQAHQAHQPTIKISNQPPVTNQWPRRGVRHGGRRAVESIPQGSLALPSQLLVLSSRHPPLPCPRALLVLQVLSRITAASCVLCCVRVRQCISESLGALEKHAKPSTTRDISSSSTHQTRLRALHRPLTGPSWTLLPVGSFFSAPSQPSARIQAAEFVVPTSNLAA